MALRRERGARRGRAPRGRAGFALLAVALYLAAGALATWPALRDADHRFLARADAVPGEVSAGDHLQLGYGLWLAGHRLGRGETPWRDPYSFRPAVDGAVNLQGWLLGVPYWPLHGALGAVRAWNVWLLLTYVLAGGAACAWLRALGLTRTAALAGGLAFALAPYRVGQSTGHLLGPISALVPLALLGLERGRNGHRGWLALAGAALVAIPLSGQLHLALGAIPLALAYAFVRGGPRARLGGVAIGAAAVAAGLIVQQLVVDGSIAAGGRSLAQVERYSASVPDLVTREVEHGIERFAFLGWLTPVLALAGAALLVRAGERAFAALLGAAAAIPVLLALGTNLPLYEPLWDVLPPLRYARVPERLLPISCLALAALAAVGVGRLDRRLAVLALALVAVDLRVTVYEAVAGDEGNPAYAALRSAPSGRVLELPVFLPERHWASAYLYYGTQAPRERLSGYSTTAPRAADRLLRGLRPATCGSGLSRLPRLGVRYVVLHGPLYRRFGLEGCARRADRALRDHGYAVLVDAAGIRLFSAGARAGGA